MLRHVLRLIALMIVILIVVWLAATPAFAALAGLAEPNPFRWPA